MSDFDKEAEREKLREKFEQEADKREATEQMSELLLKGATMTNAHCSDCGDPIFRYDGQEFCPTCEKPVDRDGDAGAAEGASDDAEDSAQQTGASGIEMTAPDDQTRVKFGQGQDTEPADQPRTGREENVASPSPASQPGPMSPADHDTAEPTTPAESPVAADTGSQAGGTQLQRAQARLTQLIDEYTQSAAGADSPQAAREYLVTAQEAAKTLDATRR
jgi:uncharacterized Zn finger protein (UPF0148 family)